MHRKNLTASSDVGETHSDLAIKATRSRERRIEHIWTIRRRDHNHLIARVKSIHLNENRVERLLALIVTARREAAAATTTDRVDFVEEDDARRILFRLLEEIAHARGSDADEHFDEV